MSVLLFIPSFSHASDNNDTDGDGLPDANETAVGRNPNFVEMHDWVANYDLIPQIGMPQAMETGRLSNLKGT